LLRAGRASAAAPLLYGIGIDPAYTPMFLAGHSQMFKAHDVDVQLQQYTQGGDAMDSLVASQVTFSGAADSTVMIRMARAELRALAIYETSGKYIKLIARKGITEPGQIKKFGIVPGTVSELSAGLMLDKFNIPAASVTMVRSGPPEMPALMARGDIDATFLWEPWPSIGLKNGGTILMTSGDVGYAYTMWITTTAAWLEKNEATAHKVVDTVAEACTRVAADPQAGAAAVQAEAKLPASQTLGFLGEVDCKVRAFGPEDMASYERIAKFLFDHKITPNPVDFRAGLMTGYAKA
jgi:NitT/TauT family transport system substrate-binding protein